MTYQPHQRPVFDYERVADQDAKEPAHRPVVIVGGGLVGLTMAIDLVAKGVPVVVLEKGETVSEGSRSICQAKRTLEIWDRLGAGDPMVEKGITWNVGKVFHRDRLLYQFDLLPETRHKMPAFVNLQQYYVEEYLLDRLHALGAAVRWQHALEALERHDDHVRLTVATPDGPYGLTCDWLIACDGARSHVRRQLGLEFQGEVFEDKFLITDVHMKPDFPSERWFWFEPPFHDGQTALLHRQADDIWRIDLQMGWDADVEAEKDPARVIPRIRQMLGDDVDFDIDWISLYVFQCRTLEDYVHGRVIFAGDSAHQVSPFGARGGNGGVQDVDNLAWKLKLILDGTAPVRLLESYTEERLFAARENILNSTRATDFMTPKTDTSRVVRDTTLAMAEGHPFARALVNPGRLSVPAHLTASPLNTPDGDAFDGRLGPGSPATDAPAQVAGQEGWWLDQLGERFVAAVHEPADDLPGEVTTPAGPVSVITLGEGQPITDPDGHLIDRYDLQPGTTYLFRPDQHIAARWRTFDAAKIDAAVNRACALD